MTARSVILEGVERGQHAALAGPPTVVLAAAFALSACAAGTGRDAGLVVA